MKHQSRLVAVLGLLLVLLLVIAGCAAPPAPADSGAAETTGETEAAEAPAEATEAPAEEAEAPAADTEATAGKEGPFTIGVSNTLVGNGWREQMICAIKAEAQRQRAGR